MTLLVLDLRVPAGAAIHSEQDLWHALVTLAPRFVPYFMTFMTLGIFWVGQQTQLNQLARTDRDLTWIHLGFILVVALTPFTTGLLAEFIVYRIALVIYWLNILLLGAVIFASWKYAVRAKLVTDTTTPAMIDAVKRRIAIAQALYAVGALLCIVSTYLSIAVIVLVQLNYVIAPRIRPLYRL
jgi:uncharacterized membrane protein